MKESIYLETTVVSYFTAKISRDIIVLKNFPHLELTKKVEKMAQIYMEQLDIPEKSTRDAIHIAVASVHNIDYLVTWNCAHIANAEVIKNLMKINNSFDIHTPIICTPEELMEV